MPKLVLSFVAGLITGGLLLFFLRPVGREHSISLDVPAGRDLTASQPREVLDATSGTRQQLATAAPAVSPVRPAGESSDSGTKTPRGSRDHDYYWRGLPELDECLARRDLNPDGLVCPNASVRKQLDRLILELNTPIAELADSRSSQISELAKAKIRAGVDSRPAWAAYSDDMIIARSGMGEFIDGKEIKGETIIVKGENSDLDATIEQLQAKKLEAVANMKEQIALLCSK